MSFAGIESNPWFACMKCMDGLDGWIDYDYTYNYDYNYRRLQAATCRITPCLIILLLCGAMPSHYMAARGTKGKYNTTSPIRFLRRFAPGWLLPKG